MISPHAQQIIASDESVQARFGIQVTQAEGGVCRLQATADSGWVNAAGFIHGSVAYALMDSACAYACASQNVLGVTVNGNITYVKGIKAQTQLVAIARVQSQSRRVMSLTAEVQDTDESLVAHGTFLFQLLAD